MTSKWISKIGFVLFFLLVFSVSRNAFTFEREDIPDEGGRNVFSPIKEELISSRSVTESSKLKRKRATEKVDTNKNSEHLSKECLKQTVKITLKGALQIRGFIEGFGDYSHGLFLTLKDIGSKDLPEFLEFLKSKQIELRGLKFKHPSFEEDKFPLIDDVGALQLADFFVKNKKNHAILNFSWFQQ
ncbi:MAG: hypothetical protein B7Y25_06325 [Alphaproteobacteria bacterium 16-39-46]|nr:MAG: hypothetical protein B7Y25_06325 [Alphaproteobacteria bacterium 16-39-46]OZA42319.1 MAG: hypothetical protein B7X84_06395 [Alphaproteobacteria bacterium 17-39-52]HQS84529.1 hypothetical protein [Alphaproteobacteria bacterium]HQS94322.1 hypothetical protein [Alphaproteobacteria bacterium]